MNLWLRLLLVLLRSSLSRPLAAPLDTSSLRFHVWPNDLDVVGHMNNGRYLAIMDLGRVNLLLRIGLWRLMLRKKWTPMVGTATVLFRRELGPFQRYRLDTRIAGWRGHLAVMEQKFVIDQGQRAGHIAALGLVRAGLYDRAKRAFVPIPEIMAELGVNVETPPLSPEIAAFLDLEEHLRRAVPGPQQAAAQ